MKKGKYPVYLLFCSGINLFDVKDFKRNLTVWSENMSKENSQGSQVKSLQQFLA